MNYLRVLESFTWEEQLCSQCLQQAEDVVRAVVKTAVTASRDHMRGFGGCAHVEQRRMGEGHDGDGRRHPCRREREREGRRGGTNRGQWRGRCSAERRMQWGAVFWRCIWSIPTSDFLGKETRT